MRKSNYTCSYTTTFPLPSQPTNHLSLSLLHLRRVSLSPTNHLNSCSILTHFTYKYHSSPRISHHFHSTFIHSSLSLSLSLSTTPMMKMAFPLSLLITLFLLQTANAHDITQILSQYSEFSTFNSYLTLTGLAAQINSRDPITVLVVDNGNLAALSAKPVDQIKNILSVHVVLDYYDAAKLQTLSATSALATTLFQTTGFALGQQGFLNITRLGTTSSIAFASAMPGSPQGSTLVKTVHSLPYNLSILQVSTAIIPQGIDGTKTSSPPSKSPSVIPVTTSPPPSSATTSPPPSSVISTSPPSSATTSPPPSSVISTPPPSPVITPPSNASSPPVAPAATPKPSAAAVPSTAPPTAAKAPIPATASPKPSTAPIPSKAAPMASKAPVPSSAPPMAQGPAIATTPSASPASSPTANAPGSALAPGVESPTLETPGETTPAEAKPKGKSAGQTLNVGLAVVFTMVLSTLCLTSSTI